MRRAASLLCLAGVLLAILGVAPARGAQQDGPVVEVFEVSGVLDASVLGALRRDLAGAERRGARVFLIQLSSFGGLGIDPAMLPRVFDLFAHKLTGLGARSFSLSFRSLRSPFSFPFGHDAPPWLAVERAAASISV